LSDHAAIAISNAQLYGEVQKANLVKSQFVSAAAHELKNPLTSIKGYSDLLLRGSVGPINEGQTRFLATVRSNAQRMGTLVSDLQDISRIEADQMLLEFTNGSMLEITNEVVSTLKKEIEGKEQILEIDLPVSLPDVWCDITRMIQILTNLVSNAHKYSPSGGSIQISAEHVRNRWDSEGAERVLHVSVLDTGLGISQEDQKMIFQQFFRSEDPRVRDSTGTGLGLSITKRLVELQGGQIWFDSELNRGTTFHFTVPVSESD
jgi:signal transduction histidine kinase